MTSAASPRAGRPRRHRRLRNTPSPPSAAASTSNTLAGAGVYRVALTLSNESTGVLLSTLTDTTGYYDFADLSPHQLHPLFRVGGITSCFPKLSALVLTTNIGNLDFVASPLYLVAGRIVDATNTSHGIQDVDVFCEYGQTVTDANGEFQLRVPAGALTVLPDHPRVCFHPFSGHHQRGRRRAFEPSLHTPMASTPSAAGLPTAASGLAGVTVSSAGRSTQTVPGGYYTLPGLAPGTNRIVPAMLRTTPSPRRWLSWTWARTGVVDVVGIDFQARQSITLSGTVSNRAATAAMDGVLNGPDQHDIDQRLHDGRFQRRLLLFSPRSEPTLLVAVQAGYGFYPPFITVVATNSTNRLNFAGFQSFSITGLALEPYNGVSNVLMGGRFHKHLLFHVGRRYQHSLHQRQRALRPVQPGPGHSHRPPLAARATHSPRPPPTWTSAPPASTVSSSWPRGLTRSPPV